MRWYAIRVPRQCEHSRRTANVEPFRVAWRRWENTGGQSQFSAHLCGLARSGRANPGGAALDPRAPATGTDGEDACLTGREERAQFYPNLSEGSGDDASRLRRHGARRFGAPHALGHRQAAAACRLTLRLCQLPCDAPFCGRSEPGPANIASVFAADASPIVDNARHSGGSAGISDLTCSSRALMLRSAGDLLQPAIIAFAPELLLRIPSRLRGQ